MSTELLSQENVNEADKENSFKIQEIEGTPFNAITNGEGWRAVCGNKAVTGVYEKLEELEEFVKKPRWGNIIPIISIIAEELLNQLNKKDNE